MTRYWTCQRRRDGIACRQRNPRIKQRCIRCGAPRPAVRTQKHMVALEAPYEYYVEITGGERCAICLRPRDPDKKRLHRDHDHRTGRPRGLLCWKCNGALPEWITAEWLRAAADYLDCKGQLQVEDDAA
jgi:ribosomal protein S14